MADWLARAEITQVVMEATGQYWKPIWYVLEEAGFQLLLAGLLEHAPAAGQLRTPGPDPRAARPGPATASG